MKRFFGVYYRQDPTFHEDDNLAANIRLAGGEVPPAYVFLRTIEVDSIGGEGSEWGDLETVFYEMQGEVWSPRGEARPLIQALGLRHTSMSVGDVVVDRVSGRVFEVCGTGFRCVNEND